MYTESAARLKLMELSQQDIPIIAMRLHFYLDDTSSLLLFLKFLVVVAGIGYFTLPYLVHAGAKHVHACEWNRYALESLVQNLELNGVKEKCTIHAGDNRKVSEEVCMKEQQFTPSVS